MASAFVTGGSGFVGGQLIERLVRDGWSVTALARSDRAADAAGPGRGGRAYFVTDGTPVVFRDFVGADLHPGRHAAAGGAGLRAGDVTRAGDARAAQRGWLLAGD